MYNRQVSLNHLLLVADNAFFHYRLRAHQIFVVSMLVEVMKSSLQSQIFRQRHASYWQHKISFYLPMVIIVVAVAFWKMTYSCSWSSGISLNWPSCDPHILQHFDLGNEIQFEGMKVVYVGIVLGVIVQKAVVDEKLDVI